MGRATASSNVRVVTTAAAVIAVVVLTGAQKSCEVSQRASSRSGSASVSAQQTSSVRYSVTSDASIRSVTYVNADGDRVTRTDVGSSWNGSGPGSGRVMVQATLGSDGSWIRCSVKSKNKVVQRASATGGGSVTVVCDVTN